MDKLSKLQRSFTMSRIRSSKTKFEKRVFLGVRRMGLRRFQENYSKVIGKPDIALPKAKKAVFLHSDFWHGWQLPRWERKLPNDFWKQKIRKNKSRDKQVLRTLRRLGWKALVVWEHSFEKDFEGSIKRIMKFLK